MAITIFEIEELKKTLTKVKKKNKTKETKKYDKFPLWIVLLSNIRIRIYDINPDTLDFCNIIFDLYFNIGIQID